MALGGFPAPSESSAYPYSYVLKATLDSGSSGASAACGSAFTSGTSECALDISVAALSSFKNDVAPALTGCSGCHSSQYTYWATAAYVTPADPAGSPMYQAPCGSSPTMPPSGSHLSSLQCSYIYQWILEGAPND